MYLRNLRRPPLPREMHVFCVAREGSAGGCQLLATMVSSGVRVVSQHVVYPLDSVYTVWRNQHKFEKRCTSKRHAIQTSVFRADTVAMMIDARRMLVRTSDRWLCFGNRPLAHVASPFLVVKRAWASFSCANVRSLCCP